MMRNKLWMVLGSVALPTMIASCAALRQESAPPPRLPLPEAATSPCRLDRLPERPTLADFESVYMARGLSLAECNAARALAVQTLVAERAMQDRWRKEAIR